MSDTSKNNSAVSPVIGTILLVAITVVLIAIITAVVMGLADAEDGKKVGMNAQPADGADAKLILYGGESLSELIKLEMIDQDSPNGKYIELWNISESAINIGLPYLAKEVAKPLEDMAIYDTRINVRGTFSDGREVILLVQPMTFYEVKGSDENSDNQIITPPEIGAPTFDSINYTSFRVYLPYSNADPTPSSAIIYYTNMSSGETHQITTTELDSTGKRFIATITGVTANKTYDVKGDIIVKGKLFVGTKNNTVDTKVPKLNPPVFHAVKTTQFAAWFSYTADSVPSSAKIYYRDVTNNGPIQNITVTDITESPIIVTINGLKEKLKYEVWGEMTTVSGTYQSTDSNTVVTIIPTLYAPGFSGYTAKSFIASFTYSNADALPESLEVRYRDVTHDGPVKTIVVTEITGNPISITIEGLSEKTQYEVWGNMTTSSGVYESQDRRVATTSTPVLYAPGFSAQRATQFTASFLYVRTDAPPTSAEIYYQDVTHGGPVIPVTEYNIGDTSITTTITGLTEKTEYKVWGNMTTSSGITESLDNGNTAKTATPVLYAPKFGKNKKGEFTAIFEYSNTDAPPTSATIYYQDVTNGGTTKDVTVTGITGSPFQATITGLPLSVTEYEVWGNMTTSSGVTESQNRNTVTTTV